MKTAIYYAVAQLTTFEAAFPGAMIEMQLPAQCAGAFLVFETLETALGWANGDATLLRPVQVTIAEPGRPAGRTAQKDRQR